MINKIEDFIIERPSYIKEGAIRLQKLVERQLGLDVTKEECRQAVRNVKIKLKPVESLNKAKKEFEEELDNFYQEEVPKGFTIKSKWQLPNGEWRISLKPIEEEVEEDILNIQDLFSDILAESKLESYRTKKPQFKSKLDLKVWTSDKHIGACGSEDNEYSAEEFENRLSDLYCKIEELSFNNNNFNTITIADLGDAIDGMDGYTVSRTHRLKQNLNNKEMFETYFRTHKKFFDNLFNSGFAANYQVWNVTNSNHGGDYEYIAQCALMEYIKAVYPEVIVINLDKFLNHVEHEGVDYVLTHGKDKENRRFGLPLFPNPQAETLIEAFLKRKDIPRQARVRLIKGDLHQYCVAPCKNIEVYKTVPSMFGTSEWVLDNFELTEAGCAYEILDLFDGQITEGVIKFK